MKHSLILILLLLMSGSAPLSNCGEGKLNSILKKIETSNRNLTSLQATITHRRTNGNLNIKDLEQVGTLLYKPSVQPKIRIDYSRPQKKVLALDGDDALLWEVEQGLVYETSQTAKRRRVFDFLMVLQAAVRLREQFKIAFAGNDVVDNQPVTHLTLTPRDAEIKMVRIEVWIEHQTWLPVKQVFYEKNQDYTEVKISNLKVNSDISDNRFKVNYGNAKKINT
ncbi:MAG: outer membrane lipoprotein carrier protein LolA [Blastocatellia bacterium]|nr:outer membrane lipoprotein carrier protein LolA [Blastocatellia bacterium]